MNIVSYFDYFTTLYDNEGPVHQSLVFFNSHIQYVGLGVIDNRPIQLFTYKDVLNNKL